MTIRVWFAALALLGVYGAAETLKGRGMPTELAHPQLKLEELPTTLGSWTGEESTLDPRVFAAIGAEMAVNRRYRDKLSTIDLHSDVFLQYGVRILHPPELCYSGSGYVVASGETVTIERDGHRGHLAQFLTLEHDGQKVYCLYWYQIGDATFSTPDEQRKVVLSLRGQTTWPPMIKVMLQTSAASPEEAEGRLRGLAALVLPWTRAYH